MDNILQFIIPSGRARRQPALVAGTACEIIILPCVRYEHWEAAPTKSKPQKKKRKKTKRRARARSA